MRAGVIKRIGVSEASDDGRPYAGRQSSNAEKRQAGPIRIFIHGAELWKLATALPGAQIVSIAAVISGEIVMSITGRRCSNCSTLFGPISGATTAG